MPDTSPQIASLYTGPELREAAARSQLRLTWRDRVSGVRNAAAILSDVALRRLRRRTSPARFELVVATGASPATGHALTAVYAGTGDNRAWCLSTAFPDPGACRTSERLPAGNQAGILALLTGAQKNADVIFTEGLTAAARKDSGLAFVSMPAWVKQRVLVLGDWPAQIDALKRITRQEAGRFLRKYQFGCHLTRDPRDGAAFYDALYKPYVARRFGEAAHLVDRQPFLKECRRGMLLRLTREDEVLGAALLRPVGRTLAVVWSALDPRADAAALRGVTDTLDYFSLLYAHLSGCRWLDLGPSRPDLADGTLRYKAKWGAELYAGLTPQPQIHWSCRGESEGLTGFLSRHRFLTDTPQGLRPIAPADFLAS